MVHKIGFKACFVGPDGIEGLGNLLLKGCSSCSLDDVLYVFRSEA